MKDWLERIKAVGWVAHLLRANKRYGARLGSQFAAAITYFSVLAVVPILMLGAAILGFIVTVVVPPLHDSLIGLLDHALGAGPGDVGQQLTKLVDGFVDHWAALGIVAIVSAAYAGAGWVKNLKSAVRAQWRPDLDVPERRHNIVVETLLNLAILIGLLVLVLISFAVSSAATSAAGLLLDRLGVAAWPGGPVLVRLVPAVASVLIGWALFGYIYLVFPQQPVPRRARVIGSLIGSVGFGVLQYLTGILFHVFTGNAAAALFGPVIVLMLFLNLFAQLTLFVAAWIATTEQPALGTGAEEVGPAVNQAEADQGGGWQPSRLRAGDPVAARAAATPVDGEVGWVPGGGQDSVPQQVAVRGVRVGMGAGYVTGAATGVGIGAMVAVATRAISQRRRRRKRR